MIRRTFPFPTTLLLLLAILAPCAAGTAQNPSIQLSLLIDSSSSIDDGEFALQVESYAALIRDPDIIPQDGSVALNAVFFSHEVEEVAGWRIIGSRQDADELADTLLAANRLYGRTAVGSALIFAAARFADAGFSAARRAIDVSGDGVVNDGVPIDVARQEALLHVDVINGLPISTGGPVVVEFYRDEVIGGPGAFYVEAEDFESFAEALRIKLEREVERGCYRPEEGAVAWWSLDEPAGPLAGEQVLGYDALHIDCPRPVEGRVGRALELDGAGPHLRVPETAAHDFGTGDFSLSVWLRTREDMWDRPLLDKREGGPARGWALSLFYGMPALTLGDGTGTGHCDGMPGSACSRYYAPTFVADGSWRHIAVTVDRDDPAGGRIYVDGVPVWTFDPTDRQGDLDTGAELWIGRGHPLPEETWFEGAIDEVQLYGVALDREQVGRLADGGREPCALDDCRLEQVLAARCLWPPNHKYVCVTDLESRAAAAGCSSVRIASCASNQPDDQKGPLDRGTNGDGDTVNDCVISDDRQAFCLRSERLGNCPSGRTYQVTLQIGDECGFNGEQTTVPFLVPHDRSGHPACEPLAPRDFLPPSEPIPFPWAPDPAPDEGLPHPFVCPETLIPAVFQPPPGR